MKPKKTECKKSSPKLLAILAIILLLFGVGAVFAAENKLIVSNPSDIMVAPPNWLGDSTRCDGSTAATSSRSSFRTFQITAYPLTESTTQLKKNAGAFNSSIYYPNLTFLDNKTLTGTGPYTNSYTLPDELSAGRYSIKVDEYPNITGVFSVIQWKCNTCHRNSPNVLPSTFVPSTVHEAHSGTRMKWGNGNTGDPVDHYNDCSSTLGLCYDHCHRDSDAPCIYCHDNPMSSTYGADVHNVTYNKKCEDCHGSLSSIDSSPSCTTSGCHNGQDVTSSLDSNSHSLSATAPCDICHNREHDIQVAYNNTQCTDCHSALGKHSAIECTICHNGTYKMSHTIDFLNTTAAYAESKSAAVNCTTCHQGTTADSFLTGKGKGDRPKVPTLFNHSNGSKWGSYWYPSDPSVSYLAALWHFDDSGGTLTDSSTQENNGTIYGDTKLLMHFDENSGESANDSSPYGNHGSLENKLKGLNSCENSGDMSGYNGLTATYSTDKKEGTYSTQVTYPASDTAWRGFISTKNYGDISAYVTNDNYLQLWMYFSEDPSLITFGQIEIGNTVDTAEYSWGDTYIKNNNDLQTGWNLITLKFGDASQGSVNWASGVDHFRIYLKSTGSNPSITIRLDDIKIISESKAIWTSSGISSSALQFDGADDYILVPDNTSLKPSQITVEAWVYPKQNTTHATVISKDNYSEKKGYLLHQLSGSDWMFRVYDGTNEYTLSVPGSVDVNTWQHITGVFDGSTLTLYKNGQLIGTPISGTLVHTNLDLKIGVRASINGQYFNGTIDEVAIYSRALNGTEIQEHYNAQRATFSEKWTAGKFGYALEFDGADDYIQTNTQDILDTTKPFSVSAWIKPNEYKTSAWEIQMVMDRDTLNSFTLYQYDRTVRFGVWNTSETLFTVVSGNVLEMDEWTHAVATYDGTNTIKLYIDGTLNASRSDVAGTLRDNLGYLTMGGGQVSGGVRAFNGTLDEVAIWDKALSSDEVSDIYNLGRGIEPNRTSSCHYCHGDTKHNASALGYAASGLDDSANVLNGSINNTQHWCAGCHLENYTYYYGDTLTISPPSIEAGGSYYPSTGVPYDHTGVFAVQNSDYTCFKCHGGALSTAEGMDVFMHNVSEGVGGGPNCTDCHGLSSVMPLVNTTAIGQSVHSTINTSSESGYEDDEPCWACHGNGSKPEAHHTNYKTPYTCTDCHTNATGGLNATSNEGNYSAPAIYEHFSNGSDIKTNVSGNGTCEVCHANSLLANNDNYSEDIGNTLLANVSHYATNATLMTATQNSTNCLYCHNSTTNGTTWGIAVQVFADADGMYDAQDNEDCQACHADYGRVPTNFHYTQLNPGGGPDCTGCHNQSAVRPFINTTAIGLGAHGGINTSSETGYEDDEPCWACHGNGTSLNRHPPNYRTPWQCADCHANDPGNYSAPTVHEHRPNAPSVDTNVSGNGTCEVCHENAILLSNDNASGGIGGTLRANVSHYVTNASLMTPTQNSTNCLYCHNDSANASLWGIAIQIFDDADGMYNAQNNSDCYSCHTDYNTVPANFHVYELNAGGGGPDCTSCHNLTATKQLSRPLVNVTVINQSIHGIINTTSTTGYEDDEPCWACHGNGSQPPSLGHPENYKTPWTCTDCHTNATGGLDPATNRSNYTAPAVFEHIPSAPDVQTNVSGNGTCEVCHQNSMSESYDNATDEIGNTLPANVSHYATNDTLMTATQNTTNCLYCHNDSANASFWGSAIQIFDDVDGMYNSQGNNDCYLCHVDAKAPPSNFHSHDLNSGVFGPDCISCHDEGRVIQKVQVLAMNTTSSIHANLNANATNLTTTNPDNKMCWGCHQSDGSEPAEGEHPDRLTDPYQCYDCHNATAKPYANASNAPNVTEHFKSGTDIQAATSQSNATASCLFCHNQTEMLVSFTEPDSTNTTLAIVSHYGKNRTAQLAPTGETNCLYCHQNTTTAFTAAMDVNATYHKAMSNHTPRSGGPTCTNSTCHASGRIHDQALTKPQTMFNDTYCQACHPEREAHAVSDLSGVNDANSVNCTDCHANWQSAKKQIHGINATYLQTDGTSYGPNTTAVNCTSCHQGAVTDVNGTAPPAINSPMNHSKDPYSGTKWGGLYWNNESALTACQYCHGDTRHNSTALGKVTWIKGNETVNSTLGATYWCANCHWNQSANYGGGNYTPAPPEITNASLVASDGTAFTDHTTYGKTDSECSVCHSSGSVTAMDIFMHSVSEGGAGPDCISCHDTTGGKPKIDAGATEWAIHGDLNSDANNGSLDDKNKPCWACHGDGTNESGNHTQTGTKGTNVKDPYVCDDCHKSPGKYGAPIKQTDDACQSCHVNQYIAFTEPDTDNTTLSLIAHYGRDLITGTTASTTGGGSTSQERLDQCLRCHEDKAYHTGMVTCELCHIESHHALLAGAEFCLRCHEGVHDTLIDYHDGECDSCHIETVGESSYRQKDEIYHKLKQPPKQQQQRPCESCHEDLQHHGGETCVDCHLKADYGSNASNLDCADCHNKEKIDINLISDENQNEHRFCINCHPLNNEGGYIHEWHEGKGECTGCHKSHKRASEVECDSCHTMDVDAGNNADINIPHMDCKSCHDHFKAPTMTVDFCSNCHDESKIQNSHQARKSECSGCHERDLHPIHEIECTDCHKGERTHTGEISGVTKGCTDCHNSYAPGRGGDCRTCHEKQEEKHCPSCHNKTQSKEPFTPLELKDISVGKDNVRLYFKDYSNDKLLSPGLSIETNGKKGVYFINILENVTRKRVTDTYQEKPYRIVTSGAPQFAPYSIRSVAVPKDVLQSKDKTEMVYTYESRRVNEPLDVSIPKTQAKIKEGEADTTVLIVHGASPFSNTDIEAAEEIQSRLANKPVRKIIETTSTGGTKYRSQTTGPNPTLFLNALTEEEQSKIKPVLWDIFNMREFDIGAIDTGNTNMPELSENFDGVKVSYHEAVLYDRDRTSHKYYTFKTNTEKTGNATPEAFVEGDDIKILGTTYTILGIDNRLEEIILGVKVFEGSIGLYEPIVYKSLQIELIEEKGKTRVQFHDKENIERHEVQTIETIYFKNAAVRIKETGETTTIAVYNDIKEIQNGGTFEGYTIDWREVDPNNLFAAYSGEGELIVNKENYNRVAEYGAIYGIRIKGKENKIGSNIYIVNDTVVFTIPDAKSYTTEVYERDVRILTDKDFDPGMKASQVYIIGGPAVNEEWGWLSNALEEQETTGFTLRNEFYKLEDYKPYMRKSLIENGTVYTICAGVDRSGTYRSVFGSLDSEKEESSLTSMPKKTELSETSPPVAPEKVAGLTEGKRGICGPATIILFSLLPLLGIGLLRRKPV